MDKRNPPGIYNHLKIIDSLLYYERESSWQRDLEPIH